MSGPRYVTPYAYAPGSTGAPIPGALLEFFLSGPTTTHAPTYADSGLTIPNINPVAANAAGVFPSIFLDPTLVYRVVESIPSDGVNPPIEVWSADPVSGTFSESYGGVYVDSLSAEVNNPGFDSYPAFALALNGSNPVVRMQGGAYYLSQGITIPDGVALIGDAFSPNLIAPYGSQLIFAAGVLTCVQVGTGDTNNAAGFTKCQVRRVLGVPPAGSIGIMIAEGQSPYLVDIGSNNHAIDIYWKSSGTNGITSHVRGLYTGAATDAHMVIDSWPELFITQCRMGVNGANDYNCNTFIRITGGAGGGGSGPNTIKFAQCQFNQANVLPNHFVEWVNVANTGSNAVLYSFVQCHIEGWASAAFFSDATCADILGLELTDCTFNDPSAPLFNLNAVTQIVESSFKGGQFYPSTFAPPAEQFIGLAITGVYCNGAATLNASAGSTIALGDNNWGAGLTLSGAGGFTIMGDSLSGGTFTPGNTGPLLVQSIDMSGARNWTPALAIGGASTGITYALAAGVYEYLSNGVVLLNFLITLLSKGALTGAVTITGLPVSSNGTYGGSGSGVIANYGNMASLTGPMIVTDSISSSVLTLLQSISSGLGTVTNANLTNTSTLQGSLLMRL